MVGIWLVFMVAVVVAMAEGWRGRTVKRLVFACANWYECALVWTACLGPPLAGYIKTLRSSWLAIGLAPIGAMQGLRAASHVSRTGMACLLSREWFSQTPTWTPGRATVVAQTDEDFTGGLGGSQAVLREDASGPSRVSGRRGM